ncbi:LysR family transcriptional regulator [Cryptosporangium aurantiacum]|uniref:DNA-binding transcriptional regulator, LysR family n=1 Tax=Cryptosporangium aurantiacum TaxID=134849 RepID=A0A1M7PCQ6_9ACTN|nr:LysR family transcriptional regulator [Cryptosporangium aurantiacum]SHN14197.1 DNA-binding transcriptional regulator, LysR family [Cryptosporangium aurantiacum]
MDARQLTYFLAIVEHLNFNRAAEQLHIAQPSLSQAIRTLEHELGVPLFHRVGRGIVLSDAGEQLIEPARQVIRDLDTAKAAVRSTRGLRRGRVELIAMPSPGMEPLSTIIARFTDDYPGMTLTVDAAFRPEEVVHAVKAGKAEVGLLGAASAPHTQGLEVLHVEDQPLVLISPPDLAPGTGPIRRSELAGMRLIASKRGSLMRQLVDDVLASGVEAQVVVEVEHRTSILPMVLSGVGHAVMPSSWTPLARRAGASVRAIQPASLLRISLVSRKGPLTPAARAFVGCVHTYIDRARPGDQ